MTHPAQAHADSPRQELVIAAVQVVLSAIVLIQKFVLKLWSEDHLPATTYTQERRKEKAGQAGSSRIDREIHTRCRPVSSCAAGEA